jgi:hypothetical protein
MRAGRSISAALGLSFCLLVLGAAPTWADETFLCADGSSVTIDDRNRASMLDHPCVKSWFADDLARREAERKADGERDAEGSRPKAKPLPMLHRHTVLRAAALRDLQKRPAYLAWARGRNSTNNGSRVGLRVRFGRR